MLTVALAAAVLEAAMSRGFVKKFGDAAATEADKQSQ
jgi:hypothetical protein